MEFPKNQPSLRSATEMDIPAIVRVTNLAYEVERCFLRGDRTHPEEIAQLMATGTFLVLDGSGAEDPLRASAYCKIAEGRGYLGLLAVDPAQQGHGHARDLVAAVEVACRAVGCRFLDLTVVNLRLELFPFYAKLGFAPFGTLPFPHPAKVLRPCHLIQFAKPLVPIADL